MSIDDDHRTADRSQIATLITEFMYRDQGEWNNLREIFHPDAMVHIMWFNGSGHQFVDTLARGGASAVSSKHVIASPLIHLRGARAVTETNAIIVAENVALGCVCTSHIRFLDRIEERDGRWRLSERRSVYDISLFDVAPKDLDRASLRHHPHEYAALAELLTLSGLSIEGTYPTRGSEAERKIRADNDSWLKESIARPEGKAGRLPNQNG